MNFLKQQWFLISLILCLGLGIWWCESLEPLARSRPLRQTVLACVMFVTAWSLETSVVVKTLFRPGAALLASVINLGLIPLLAKPLSLWLGSELAVALIVATATPCTLASAAVWTRRAGGNDVIAVLTTVITNGVCFLVMPFWIVAWVGRELEGISFVDMMNRLLMLVIAPMVIAQLTRINRRIATWSTARKHELGLFALLGVLLMVVVGAVETGLRMADGERFAWGEWIWVGISCAALHFGSWWLGFRVTNWCGFPRGDAIAVGFAGSQKTLMVGLVICLQLGVSVLPLVMYHAIQLIGDTLIADRLRGPKRS